jgi:hypothetical protein
MHATVVETVISLVVRGLAKALEVFDSRPVCHIMFSRHSVQPDDIQPRQKLGR